jgi:hypothetical protein
MSKHLCLALLALILTNGCAHSLDRLSENERAERLAREKGRVNMLTDSVQKTRSYIVISQILLDFSTAAARDSDHETMRGLLDEYTASLQSALETMSNSDRNAERQPAGFKELEMSVRKQLRQLEDLNRSLAFEQRAPVEGALKSAVEVRDTLLGILFPQTSSIEAVHHRTALSECDPETVPAVLLKHSAVQAGWVFRRY